MALCVRFLVVGLLLAIRVLCMLQLLTERPKIVYLNPRYFKFYNITSIRYDRRSLYYVSLNVDLKTPLGNNVTVELALYQAIGGRYQSTLASLRLPMCDLILRDMTFGHLLRHGGLTVCPVPPGQYHVNNMSTGNMRLPNTWYAIQRGRVYINLTLSAPLEAISASYLDFEFRKLPQTASRKGKQ